MQVIIKRRDHKNRDGCGHSSLIECRKNWCWLAQELSSACFWEEHHKCSKQCYNPNLGTKLLCSCLCHQPKTKKYLSPFTNQWV